MKKPLFVLLLLGALFTIYAQAPNRDATWQKLAALQGRIDGTKVLSGNELEIAGIRCRLMGVQIPNKTKDDAKRFLELYVNKHGGYFSIYNVETPINDKDGFPLIWLRGNSHDGWAQEALVRVGLATVSYSGFDAYKFSIPMKSGFNEFDWKNCLKEAESDYKAGRKPYFTFKWPPPN